MSNGPGLALVIMIMTCLHNVMRMITPSGQITSSLGCRHSDPRQDECCKLEFVRQYVGNLESY